MATYNDKVRVLRIKYGPHEKSVMHGHPALIGVCLNDAKARLNAGEVLHFDAIEHDPKNLGDAPFELIAVELKV